MNKQGDIMCGSFISSEAGTEKTEADERRSNNMKGLSGGFGVWHNNPVSAWTYGCSTPSVAIPNTSETLLPSDRVFLF